MHDVDYLISKARSALAKVRTVKAGDYVLSSDHNSIVDALRALEELSEALKDYADSLKSEATELATKVKYAGKARVEVFPTHTFSPEARASIAISTSKQLSPEARASIEVSVS